MPFRPVAAAIPCILIAVPALAQPLYTVTDLGRHPDYTYSTVPISLNNAGQVVGWVQGSSITRAFVWTQGTSIQPLPPVPGNEARGSVAVDINDLGEIVGYSGAAGGSNIVAWVFRNNSYTFIPGPAGLESVMPAAINNNTEVVGTLSPPTTTGVYGDFYWSPATGRTDLAPGIVEPFDINDAGLVTGGVRGDPAQGLMTWNMRTGQAVDLGMLPNIELNFGYSINEAGQVAGVSIDIVTPSGARVSHPVLAQDGYVSDLGPYQAVANSINEHGQIVGWRTNGPNSTWYSWLYTPGQGVIDDLHAVIDQPALFTRISNARAINDRGQIIATSALSSGVDPFRRAVILTPVAACGSADFNHDGDPGTDADIESFFACIAGSCCTACGTADFNADGDTGTDADIESFFRVLAGGAC